VNCVQISDCIVFRFLSIPIPGAEGWTIGWSRFDPRQGHRIFLLAPAYRPALRPTQPPIQWVPRVLSPGVKRGRGVTLTTHPHLVAEVKYE
jgi:hypothetical protein